MIHIATETFLIIKSARHVIVKLAFRNGYNRARNAKPYVNVFNDHIVVVPTTGRIVRQIDEQHETSNNIYVSKKDMIQSS